MSIPSFPHSPHPLVMTFSENKEFVAPSGTRRADSPYQTKLLFDLFAGYPTSLPVWGKKKLLASTISFSTGRDGTQILPDCYDYITESLQIRKFILKLILPLDCSDTQL